jgi:hypothetical protein
METLYLISFLLGIGFSVVFLLGSVHDFHLHFGHDHHAGIHTGHDLEVSMFNPSTIAAFLTGFGGTGTVLSYYPGLWGWVILAISGVVGLLEAAGVFHFLVWLIRHDHSLSTNDSNLIGQLGYVSTPIAAGGTGEFIYVRRGSRHACTAKSYGEEMIAREVEVVVLDYAHGVVLVKPFQALMSQEGMS